MTDNKIYNGCGTSKRCFGFPDTSCLSSESCPGVGTVSMQNGKYIFELQALSGNPQPAYIALGLSDDLKMGDDSVIECVPSPTGEMNAFTSYTSRDPYAAGRDKIPQDIITLIESSFNDGTIYCKIERKTVSEVRGREFNLVNDTYHVFLALGEHLKEAENTVGYHSIGKTVSAERLSLLDMNEPTLAPVNIYEIFQLWYNK